MSNRVHLANRIYCDECFQRFGPLEDKCCTHGCGEATCAGCGKTRTWDDKPSWHCTGSVPAAEAT
jgi:hypothetical protein